MILSIIAIVLAVASLVYGIHVAVVFQRFNDGIKDWSESIDSTTNAAIQRAARQILKELDEKITEQRALERQELENEEDVEPLNDNNNE